MYFIVARVAIAAALTHGAAVSDGAESASQPSHPASTGFKEELEKLLPMLSKESIWRGELGDGYMYMAIFVFNHELVPL